MSTRRMLVLVSAAFASAALVASSPTSRSAAAQERRATSQPATPQGARPSTPVEIVAPVPVPVSGSLGISGTPNVVVANTTSSPVVVSDADNPAKSPFQAFLCSADAFNGG